MKKLLTSIFAFSTLFIFAQTPQGINYQSIIRSTGGLVLPNTPVNIEFKLYNGLAGALAYNESHSTNTNSFGMVNLIIGQGSPISGTFNTITWSNGIAYEVYVNSTLIGTKQLFMSVPYALNAGSAPAPSVSFINNILSVGGNTTALPSGNTYTAGNGIDITGSVISGTANIVGVGATTVTGIYPNLTINTPTTQVYTSGNGISITTGGVINNTAPAVTPTITVSGNNISVNPGNSQALPNYSLTQSGSNIDLTQNGISIATVTLTAATSTSLTAGNSNILINQSGNAYTITPVTPTFTNAGPTTITGTYPNYTINSVPTASTTLAQGNNISLNQSGNTYTVSASGYSISLPGGNTVQITNGTSTSTAAIASTSLTLTGPNTNILSAGGNTVALNTYTAGTGISVTGTAPNFVINNTATALTPTIIGVGMASVTPAGNTFTVSVPSPSYTPTTGVLSFGGTNTVIATPSLSIIGNVLRSGPATNTLTLPPPVITGTGTGIATVTASINNFTVNVPSPTYLPGTGVLNFGGTNTVIVTPTLALTGTTLTSGAATNSVNLSSLSVWSNSVGVLYPTILTNSVGIGTSGPLGGRFAISHTSSSVTPHVNLISPAGGFGKVKFTNTGQGNYFSIEGRNNGGGANDGFSISQFNGTNDVPVFLVTGERKVNINNLNSILASFHVMENATTAGGGIISEGFAKPGQIIIARNNQPALAARTAVGPGDTLGKLKFTGFNGGAFSDGGIISVTAAEAFTGSNNGSQMSFKVAPINGNAAIERLRITSRGKVVVTDSLQLPFGFPAPGKVLTSDNFGNVSWQNVTAPFAPWVQGAGVVTLNNINDQVGIGTNSPGSLLDIRSTATSTLITAPILNISNTHNTYATPTGMVNIENLAGTGDALYVKNSTFGGGITTVLTNTTSNGTGISSTVNGLGNAGYFQVNNVNSNAKTIEAYNNGGSNTIHSINTGSTTGAAGYFQINNSNSNGAAIDVYSNSNNGAIRGFSNGSGNAGTFNINNTSSTANALFAGSNANTFALRSIHTGTASGAAIFDVIDPLNSNNTIEVYNGGIGTSIFASNTSSTNAAARFTNTGQGMALSVENTSNTDPTAYILNNGTGPALVVNGKTTITDGTQGLGKILTSDGSGNASWQAPAIGSNWSLNGNSLTGTEFLGSSNAQDVVFKSGGTELMRLKSSNAITFTAGQYSMTASTSSNPALTITGANFQSTQLNMKVSSNVTGIGNLGSIAFSDGTNSTTQAYIQGMREAAGGVVGDLPTALLFYTTPDGSGTEAERMRISNNGRVGIGSNAPSAMLHAINTATTGSAGRFENNTSTNTADAAFVTNSGTGAAVHAVSATTSTVGLWLEGGHLKSTSATAPVTSTVSVSGITSVVLTPVGCTDVKGNILAVVTHSGNINSGNSVTYKVTFNKAYQIAPTVILTPTTDFGYLYYFVSGITTTSFNVTIRCNVAGTESRTNFGLNYMVIE